MSAFLHLPDELCKSILLELLELKSWGILDIALGCSGFGPNYKNCLHNLTAPSINSEGRLIDEPINYRKLYEWGHVRSVKFSEAVLNESFFVKQIRSKGFCPIRLESVLHLHVGYLPDVNVNSLINSCINLTALSCFIVAIDFTELNTCILQGLKYIKLYHVADQPDLTLSDYSKALSAVGNCTQLESFKTAVSPSLIDRILFLNILTANPKITDLDLCGEMVLVEGIMTHCAGTLTCLQIRNDLNIASIVRILKGCPLLIDLSVGPSTFLSKREGSLRMHIPREFVGVGTWEELSVELLDVTSIELTIAEHHHFPTLPALFRTIGPQLRSLKLTGHVDSIFCSTILSHCSSLIRLNLSVWCQLDMGALFAHPNHIETLILRCAFDKAGIMNILALCKHLKKCVVSSTWLGCSLQDDIQIEMLRAAMHNYRNVQHCNASLKVEWETTSNIYSLDVETQNNVFYIFLC